ncbi:bifunctional DNA-formamidopyrimidine glycosylase/DNA-(apurinic or apyrimidinic site) lyase [Formicincola oecophyllae]|nr:bifunctional DNA-formamidopyrimidine glycosylase/DNA-(apurinic or apyrimidinic site) lyase [Formicincola oecophyllae]
MKGIKAAFEGATLAQLQLGPYGLRRPFDPRTRQLRGQRLGRVRRLAKYILLDFEDPQPKSPGGEGAGWSLALHLGMSGRALVTTTDSALGRHDHVVLDFTLPQGGQGRLVVTDPRRFGALDLLQRPVEGHPPFNALGPDPLEPGFTKAALAVACKGRRAPIKNLLLDQKAVVGLGNIYVCEALFRAAIHPAQPACTLRPSQLAKLHAVIPPLLRQAVAAGGSTLRDHAGTDGRPGAFQQLHQVYGREGQPCVLGGAPHGTIKRMVQAGRSTFHCPTCQPPGTWEAGT